MRRILLMTAVLLLWACHGSEDQEKTRKSIASWRATLALLGTSWSRQEVPDAYANLILHRAEDELTKLHSDDLVARTRALEDAVEHRARGRAAALARELRPKS